MRLLNVIAAASLVVGAVGLGAQTGRRITIDVKPGDEPTTVEPTRGGMLPIAIITTPQFDAATVDPTSITAGAMGTEASIFRSTMSDVDKDGDLDRLCLIRVNDMALTCSVTTIQLRARAGTEEIWGSETVKMDGCDAR